MKADNPFGIAVRRQCHRRHQRRVEEQQRDLRRQRIINPNGALGIQSASSQQPLFGVTTGGNIAQTAQQLDPDPDSRTSLQTGEISTAAAPIKATLTKVGSAPGSLSARAGIARRVLEPGLGRDDLSSVVGQHHDRLR